MGAFVGSGWVVVVNLTDFNNVHTQPNPQHRDAQPAEDAQGEGGDEGGAGVPTSAGAGNGEEGALDASNSSAAAAAVQSMASFFGF